MLHARTYPPTVEHPNLPNLAPGSIYRRSGIGVQPVSGVGGNDRECQCGRRYATYTKPEKRERRVLTLYLRSPITEPSESGHPSMSRACGSVAYFTSCLHHRSQFIVRISTDIGYGEQRYAAALIID